MPKNSSRNHAIDVYCSSCNSHIYKYLKEGEGHLLKCYKGSILSDFTKKPMHCPGCGQEFSREAFVHNRPAFRIIQGKVYVKG